MAMTVGELKADLAGLDDSLQVVLSKDGEGNGFSPLEAYSLCEYTPESTYSGDVKVKEPEEEQAIVDWDSEHNEVNAICLWPVN